MSGESQFVLTDCPCCSSTEKAERYVDGVCSTGCGATYTWENGLLKWMDGETKGTGEVPVELISARKWQHLFFDIREPPENVYDLVKLVQDNAHDYGKQEGREEQREVDAGMCEAQKKLTNSRFAINSLGEAAEAIRNPKITEGK